MKYIPVIGLEIHAELLTKSKVFCGCANEFGGEENTRVCPVCSGMPGTLPVVNQGAVELAAKAGFALGCTVNNYSAFDRKNYFYPDLPKAYQITQFQYPICSDGIVRVCGKDIRINRIHIEEDAGKLIHDDAEGISMADYNRCGVPLIEIVTEPDFRCVEEVQAFVEEIARRLKYADVCDARMEQGSLRVDVNISIMPENTKEFGTRAEIKNLNSVRAIGRAIEYEITRQTNILEHGGRVTQETRRFNDRSGETASLRSKEEAHDYRYFPEPDIPPVFISEERLDRIKAEMPEMPNVRFERYTNEYGLLEDEARLIVEDKAFSDFYDETVGIYPAYKETSNLMLVELNRCLNDSNGKMSEIKFTPQMLAELVSMSDKRIVTKNAARDILAIMFETGSNPESIARENNLVMSTDTDELERIVEQVIAQNADGVESYKNGNEKIIGFLMGQIIRILGKSADMKKAKEILLEKIK
ncbi:MAG: Asp-tRNA(Asn)/Glu-tRNA(Gln) amidotransferase subunit GatB [Eubacteriales bacterium]|nr:Asp-tRNA(Asn)/Glu-tRNA(Gln) amidotransferase subunit GatB [Eubacteriales bacterium]